MLGSPAQSQFASAVEIGQQKDDNYQSLACSCDFPVSLM